MPPSPVALMEELIEEILLRFPPDDPAPLFRAALVCKAWCRLISAAAFRRRFRKIHRTPPLLGLICLGGGTSSLTGFSIEKTQFTPTSTFRLPSAKISNWRVIDALHGRILFRDMVSLGSSGCSEFVVWSPITGGEVRRLPMPCLRSMSWSAALLCASTVCDDHHLDCGYGAFAVVLVATHSNKGLTSVYIYSSEQHVWSEPISNQDWSVQVIGGAGGSTAIVGKTVYFRCVHERTSKLLAHELCKQQLSFVSLPSVGRIDVYDSFALKKADEGKLGLLMVREDAKLSMWSREAAPDGDADWTLQRVFELDKMLPPWVLWYHYKLFAAPSSNDVFVLKVDGLLFTLDLKSGRVTELLLHGWRADKDISHVFPYISFCIPCIVCPKDT
ncbi:hypothetical protein EJB05_40819, partial [Eragrostis curvula]